MEILLEILIFDCEKVIILIHLPKCQMTINLSKTFYL